MPKRKIENLDHWLPFKISILAGVYGVSYWTAERWMSAKNSKITSEVYVSKMKAIRDALAEKGITI